MAFAIGLFFKHGVRSEELRNAALPNKLMLTRSKIEG
jgi:hypothetical protein